MNAEEPERLRQLLVGLIEDVRVLIVKRVQTRLAAVQVFFAGGSERSYLVRWTRCVSLPKCRKPESVIVYSFARRPTLSPGMDKLELTVLTPAIDLRDREQVNRVERALMKLDLTQPLNQFANDAETATDVHIWLSCLEWSPN